MVPIGLPSPSSSMMAPDLTTSELVPQTTSVRHGSFRCPVTTSKSNSLIGHALLRRATTLLSSSFNLRMALHPPRIRCRSVAYPGPSEVSSSDAPFRSVPARHRLPVPKSIFKAVALSVHSMLKPLPTYVIRFRSLSRTIFTRLTLRCPLRPVRAPIAHPTPTHPVRSLNPFYPRTLVRLSTPQFRLLSLSSGLVVLVASSAATDLFSPDSPPFARTPSVPSPRVPRAPWGAPRLRNPLFHPRSAPIAAWGAFRPVSRAVPDSL